MQGMTLKQMRRAHYYRLLDIYAATKGEGPEFIAASVALHAAKGGVPKRLWPLANKAFRNLVADRVPVAGQTEGA